MRNNPYDHQDIRYNSWDDGFTDGFVNGWTMNERFDFDDIDNRELVTKAIHNAVAICSDQLIDTITEQIVKYIFRKGDEQ